MAKRNIELLAEVARRLGSLLEEVVFVGGCTTALFISDEGAAEVRATFDVDVIAQAASYAEYANFGERLRLRGFREDTSEGAPLCRWLTDGFKLDLMPTEERILGFTNRWYRSAIETATETELEPGLRIWVVTAPYFVATKLEAFRGRGRSDYANSHDLEDLLSVVDGRAEIINEIGNAEELRAYIAEQFRGLLASQAFLEALPGYLLPDAASQSRLPILVSRITEISR